MRSASKAFGATQALDDVSVDVGSGEIHGLVGENGSGKSTLIKVLAGVVVAEEGTLEFPDEEFDLHSSRRHAYGPNQAREAGLRFVHQQASTFPDLTVAENLAIGRGFEVGLGGRIRWRDVRERTVEVLRRFGIDARPETHVGDLGAATQMMVAIARALQDQAERHEGILVLDEPTASLPKDEVDFLLTALRRYAGLGQTVIYVTHRLEEVVSIADRATVLRDGRVAGTLSGDEIDHDSLVNLMVGHEVSAMSRSNQDVGPATERARVLEADAVGRGKIDLRLYAGEVVGVAGLLGSGRSGLLRALFGAEPGAVGRVTVDGRQLSLDRPREAMDAGIAYIAEDRVGSVFPDLSIGENLAIAARNHYARWGRVRRGAEQGGNAAAMKRFLVRGASVNDPITSLSGGNQQKVVLARWLQREPRVLLLDEPTQGVDVGARAEIHLLIRRAVEAGATALLVSSDVDELTSISDRVLVMSNGALVAELVGDEIDEATLDSMVYSMGKEAA